MKIGFLFAGQGQQFKTMGVDLANEYEIVKETYDLASKILGYDMLELCQNNSNNELSNTLYTQPVILTFSNSIYRLLKSKNITPVCVAGLSLGEYNALIASDVLSFEDTLNIIKQRASIMDNALKKESTKMAAVLKADIDLIEEILKNPILNNEVSICNYNTFDQVVIGGNVDKLDIAINLLKENNQKRIILLDVSTVSHMHLLNKASIDLEDVLKQYYFNTPKIDFINNVDALKQTSEFVSSSSKQISNPTLMAKTIKLMLEEDINVFIEIGPGKAISGFVKSIAKSLNKEVIILNICDIDSLNNTLEKLGEINE